MRRSKSVWRLAGRLGVVLMITLGLAACGGGGGGGASFPTAPSTPITITSTNAAAVAGDSADAITGATDSGAMIVGAEVSSVSSRLGAFQVLRDAIVRRNELLGASEARVSGVVTSFDCFESGTIVIDAANNGTSETITFNNCSDVPGLVINGSIRIFAISGTETNFSAKVSMDFTITVNGELPLRSVGDFDFAFTNSGGVITVSITGTRLALVSGSHVIVVTNLNIANTDTGGSTETTVSFDVASTRLNGKVSVSTVLPVQHTVGALYPSSGVFVVRGVNSGLQVTINGDESFAFPQVVIDVDLDGDGAYDDNRIEANWLDLAAA